MLENNKCKNCGANVIKRGGGYYCEYCGSTYVEKGAAAGDTAHINMERPTMTDTVLKTVAFPNSGKGVIIPIIVFAVIWVVATLTISISMFQMDGFLFMGIVPLFMGVLGVVIFIAVIKSALGSKEVNQASKLANENKWEEAYSILKQGYSKKITAMVGLPLVLIAFYKYKDDESAKRYIKDLNQLNCTGNAKIKEVADYLGVPYKYVSYSKQTTSYAMHSESINIDSTNAAVIARLAAASEVSRSLHRSHMPPSGMYGPHGYGPHGPGGFGPHGPGGFGPPPGF